MHCRRRGAGRSASEANCDLFAEVEIRVQLVGWLMDCLRRGMMRVLLPESVT